MSKLKQHWQNWKQSTNQITGLGSFWQNMRQAARQYSGVLLIAGALLAFGLALWLSLSILSGIGNTFAALNKIHPSVGWAFLVVLLVSLLWIGLYIAKLVRNIKPNAPGNTNTGNKLDVRLFGQKGQEITNPKELLPVLSLPTIKVDDLLQPGHRQLIECLAHASNEADYQRALKQLHQLEKRHGQSDPDLLLAQAQSLLKLERWEHASRILQHLSDTYPNTRFAKDAHIIALSAELEFGLDAPLIKQSTTHIDPPTQEPVVPVVHATPITQHNEALDEPIDPMGDTRPQPTQLDDDFWSAVQEPEPEPVVENTDVLAIPETGYPWRQTEPTLGGILLKNASQYEWLLEEADRYREAGEHTKGHELLRRLMAEAPRTRYAKDALMRLVGDKLLSEVERKTARADEYQEK